MKSKSELQAWVTVQNGNVNAALKKQRLGFVDFVKTTSLMFPALIFLFNKRDSRNFM